MYVAGLVRHYLRFKQSVKTSVFARMAIYVEVIFGVNVGVGVIGFRFNFLRWWI